jgi:basic membrane lipoprotein Med (substrate-binding protein (PBP1-ABC) superfamily)
MLAMAIGGCAPAAPAASTAPASEVPVAATKAPATAPETQAASTKLPTELHIAAIFASTMEEPYSVSWMESFKRVQAEKPHGLNITLDYTENVFGDAAAVALEDYAKSGKYDIIWATSSYSDQVKLLKDKYPNILWVVSGSGNQPLGGNVYMTYTHRNEPGYLLGVVAGMMTKSNVLGVVAGYPSDDVNDAINGYIDGAKSVNPNVKVKVTFIQSWYDPTKAKEATYALVASGADYIFAERLGPFDACAEKGCFAFGTCFDQNYMSPKVVVSSELVLWDPLMKSIIDAWVNHVTTGQAYNAPTEPIWFGMKDGGSDIAPFHDFESILPANVLDKVKQLKADIMSGKLQVPYKVQTPPSD